MVVENIEYDQILARSDFALRKYRIDEELINDIFPKQYCDNREIIEDNEYFRVSYNSDNWIPNITQKWEGPGSIGDVSIGDACAIPVLDNNKGLNTISIMFALSYTYGMMARYYPSAWISLGRVEKGDRIYPLIHKTLNFIEEKFPLVVLDFLRAPYGFEK